MQPVMIKIKAFYGILRDTADLQDAQPFSLCGHPMENGFLKTCNL